MLGLAGGLGFTSWWRRRELGAIGPQGAGAPFILPRPAGALVGIISLAVLGIGIAYTFKGLRYLVLKPTLAQLRWSDLLGLSPRGVGFAFTVGGFLVAMLGGALFRVARALGRADTRRLLAVDHRPPVLYLRSFDDDTLPLATIASARRPFFELLSFRGRDPFEEAVAWELATYGPVVAVGRPGRSLASLGAAREHLSDDTWKAQVAGRMHDARAIALAAGETPGLHWEVAQVVAAGHLAKTVFILPPLPADALARRWTFTAAALSRPAPWSTSCPRTSVWCTPCRSAPVEAWPSRPRTIGTRRRTAPPSTGPWPSSRPRRPPAAGAPPSPAPGLCRAAAVAVRCPSPPPRLRRRPPRPGCAAARPAVAAPPPSPSPLARVARRRRRASCARRPACRPTGQRAAGRSADGPEPDGRRAAASRRSAPLTGSGPGAQPGQLGREVGPGPVLARLHRCGHEDDGAVEEGGEDGGPAGPPALVVDVGVLGPHAGHVGLVAGGLRGQDGEVGVQHDRGRR